jgi:hypothetical protein
MIRFDIDRRGADIEEAKVDILSTALREAAREAGLSEEDQRKLGQGLRRHLQLVEASA